MAYKGSFMENVSVVVWDWNGTLLNDVDVNIASINCLLARRGIPTIKDLVEYREGFGFPIIDYYRTLGFDMESENFSDIADEYVRVYSEKLCETSLFPDVEAVLKHFREHGIRQVIVSAAEGERLRAEVKSFGISDYFTDIIGTGDNLGSSKILLGTNFVAGCGVTREEIVFIGDLLHDAELAAACGCRAVLVAAGHQSARRLAASGCDILSDLGEILDK